jgi:hypothetical protein
MCRTPKPTGHPLDLARRIGRAAARVGDFAAQGATGGHHPAGDVGAVAVGAEGDARPELTRDDRLSGGRKVKDRQPSRRRAMTWA